MNFIIKDINQLKKISIIDRITLLIYSFIPIFLIIGTGVSELAIIILSLKFTIDFIFLKKIKFHNRDLIYFLLLIYLSLIINSFFSVNSENSFFRNILFFKYIVFIIGTIDFFTKRELLFNLVIKIWTIILIVFSIDLFIQFFTQKNIIGIESPLKYHRLSGFMGDELKAGALLLSFCFIISGYFINHDKYKLRGLVLLFLFVMTIFITGDRSNFFKSILIVSFLILFIDRKFLKQTIGLFLISISLITIFISTNQVFKERFQNKILNELKQNEFNIIKFINQTEYGKIYSSAYELFLEKKVFGVGNKNYRILCEKDYKNKYSLKKEINNPRCNTHPHQIYYEILSEHGIFGFTVLIICLLGFVCTNLIFIFKKKNFLLISIFFSILIVFIPLLPGGSFFTSFNASMFWLNVSFYYSYKNLCIKKRY